MTRTVSLLEPASAKVEKSMVQIMREAEKARAKEIARMARNLFGRIADFLEGTTSEQDHVETRRPKAGETRLAA